MKYDAITIGSAAIDIFLKSNSKDIEYEKIHSHQDVCFPIGAKILMNTSHTETGGSAINPAIGLRKLGFKTAAITKLGKDIHGLILQKKLKEERIDFLGTTEKGSTGQSIILTGLKGNRTILAYKGNSNKLKIKDIDFKKLNTKWLYFGTLLDQGWQTQCKIAQYAKKKGTKILFNPSLYLAEKGLKYLKPVLDATTILILNKEEAKALTGQNIKQSLLLLQQKIPIVVITDGPRGAHAYNGIKTYSIYPKQVKVTDTTGAGDAFASAFLAGTLLKKDIQTALKWGAAQANSTIQHYGATNKLLNRKEIEKQSKNAGKVREEKTNKVHLTSSRKTSEE